MSDDITTGLAAWLALNRFCGTRFYRLLEQYPDPLAVLDSDGEALSPAWRKRLCDVQVRHGELHDAIRRDVEWLAQHPHVHTICWDDPRYPPLLKHIADPPPVLFVQGEPAVLQHPQLAIVGSRQATRTGLEDAFRFARELASHGIGISSGLARGIDAAAHEGALAAQGLTLAVMATGPDQVYPGRHRKLADNILAGGGALVTEFAPGTAPLPAHFPQRNRIISGLAMGVLVVQAALKSGTLVTARLAMEQGREVFAIPGSIHQPHSRGCHQLIRQGVALVETVDDILQELGGFQPHDGDSLAADPRKPAKLLQRVLDSVDFHPTDIDTIVERSGKPAATVLAQLTELELDGWVTQEAGGFSRLPA